jgi:hypothetical protein
MHLPRVDDHRQSKVALRVCVLSKEILLKSDMAHLEKGESATWNLYDPLSQLSTGTSTECCILRHGDYEVSRPVTSVIS